MTKQQQLDQIKKKVETTSLPLKEGATQIVFGDGNPNSKLFFLGEAPGRFEDLEGKPFVGQSGKLLDRLLQQVGLTKKDVYITSLVFYRPPGNRTPTLKEFLAFDEFIDKQIAVVDPKVIVSLGRFSLQKFIPGVKISQLHGQIQDINWRGKKIKLLPLYHPAAALRSPLVMELLKADFKKIKQLL